MPKYHLLTLATPQPCASLRRTLHRAGRAVGLQCVGRFSLHRRTPYRYADSAPEPLEARLTRWVIPAKRSRLAVGCFAAVQPTPYQRLFRKRYGDLFSRATTSGTYPRLLRRDGDVAVRPTLHRSQYEHIGSCPRLPSEKLKLFDFLAPSTAITLDVEVYRLAHKFFRPGDGSGRTLLGLTR